MAEAGPDGKSLRKGTLASTFRYVDQGIYMTINITNNEADRLTRKLAKVEGVGLTEAVVIAMKEALARRRAAVSPLETAARLRKQFGVALTDERRRPLPRSVYDEFSGEAPREG
jgi:antitoxin VapB